MYLKGLKLLTNRKMTYQDKHEGELWESLGKLKQLRWDEVAIWESFSYNLIYRPTQDNSDKSFLIFSCLLECMTVEH